ncbi:MAG: efflux RND transporter permease subunit [Chthoniobacter sp.]|uniref:efflux RND transporter permease subunit n=1 Tax=Chthoniobacter sp. TaxID=2510640 RepID=UPI0032ADA3FD
MNVSEPFIRRPAGTFLLAIGLLIMGLVAYHFLPVAPLPRVDFPMISVSAQLPGADPQTVASSLAAPLERRIGQIAGVTEMTSTSALGSTGINVQFDLDRSVDGAARDVQRAIDEAASDLPANLPTLPSWRKQNPADAPILILAMTSDTREPTQVFQYADEIVGQQLSQLKGVGQVVISGAEKSAVRVQANPASMASAGLSLEDLRSFLAQVNVDLPKGSVDGDKASYAIYSNDQLMDAGEYRNLIVATKNGVPIKLSSIAKIVNGVENTRLGGWAGVKPAVLVIVFKQPDANVIATTDLVKAALPKTEKWLPPSVRVQVISDRTVTIRASLEEVQFSLLLSIALVVMVIFLFLRRFWPTFIASVTVPLSLAGTFGVMYLLHYSLDNISLMAVTISVGFVVDDAIVVIENVFRFVEAGTPPMEAALKGAKQIGFTIISISLSLIAVFGPLLFMGGLIGRLFHEFAVTLSAAIVVSGIISLTLTPMLCSRFLKAESQHKRKDNFIQRRSEASLNWLLSHYASSLQWVLRHQIIMLVVTGITVAMTVWLYGVVPKGFFPQQDTGQMHGTTVASQDVSFPQMVKLQQRISQILLEDPAIETFSSFVGSSYRSASVNNGSFFLSLKPKSERKISADELIGRIRKKTAGIEGIRLILSSDQDIRVGSRGGSKGQYQYALQSGDLEDLNQWTPKLMAALAQHPEIKDIDSDLQTRGLQTNVVVDRDAAARLGVSPLDVDNTLYDAFGQRQVSTIYEQYNQHHVILEVDPEFQTDPAYLSKIFVKSNTGAMVPLSSVSKFQTTNAYLTVSHQGQFPAATISFNLAPGVSLGRATEIVEQAKRDLNMPSTVNGSFQGTAQVFQQSLSSLKILVIAALITVYIVLGMLYESLIHPITILSTLPSAGLGALLALILCGSELSLVSFIAIILLMGIVKKNAIMMVDFALDAERNEGMGPEEAIYQACVVRFRPIMMTTMAALLGAVPLAIGFGVGSELRQPLGIAVVGGLIVSQILTLYTTPVIYLAFEHLRLYFRRRQPTPSTRLDWQTTN